MHTKIHYTKHNTHATHTVVELFTSELFEPFELFLVPTLIPFLFLLTESRTPDQLPEDEIPFQVIPFNVLAKRE